MPPGVPGDEAGFCALVAGAGGAAAVVEGGSSGGGPLAALARALVGRVRAAEAAMEEDEVGVLDEGVRWVGWGWLCKWVVEGPACDYSDVSLSLTHIHTIQSVQVFLAARGCPYLATGSAADVLSFLATELQVSFVWVVCNVYLPTYLSARTDVCKTRLTV